MQTRPCRILPKSISARQAAPHKPVAIHLYLFVSTDSGLGFEASNHYFCVPHDLSKRCSIASI